MWDWRGEVGSAFFLAMLGDWEPGARTGILDCAVPGAVLEGSEKSGRGRNTMVI